MKSSENEPPPEVPTQGRDAICKADRNTQTESLLVEFELAIRPILEQMRACRTVFERRVQEQRKARDAKR